MSNLFQIHSSTYEGAGTPAELTSRQWDVAVVGSPIVDARSRAACDFARQHAAKSFCLRFISDRNQTFVDGTRSKFGAICSQFCGARDVLVEATALTCPELLYTVRAAVEHGVTRLSFLYLEPASYRRRIAGNLTDHRDFDLSENRRFRSVHGFMADLAEAPVGQAVFFLGFEKARLGQALEQEEILGKWSKHAVFGVPAFEPAWEIDSIANNVEHLAASKFELQYAAASSAQASYELLNGLLLADKERRPIVVAPLGTKPHTVGASLFLFEHNACGRAILLYDHPDPVDGRSYNVRRWHLFDVIVRSTADQGSLARPPSS